MEVLYLDSLQACSRHPPPSDRLLGCSLTPRHVTTTRISPGRRHLKQRSPLLLRSVRVHVAVSHQGFSAVVEGDGTPILRRVALKLAVSDGYEGRVLGADGTPLQCSHPMPSQPQECHPLHGRGS